MILVILDPEIAVFFTIVKKRNLKIFIEYLNYPSINNHPQMLKKITTLKAPIHKPALFQYSRVRIERHMISNENSPSG